MGQKPKKQTTANKAKPNNAAKGKSTGRKSAKAQTAKKPVSQNKEVKTIYTAERNSKVEYIVVNIISLFVFLAFGYITIMSFLQTSVIDPAAYSSEKVLYQNDIVILNLLFTAIFFAVAFAFRKTYNFFSKINIRFFEIGIAVWVVLLGFVWILV